MYVKRRNTDELPEGSHVAGQDASSMGLPGMYKWPLTSHQFTSILTLDQRMTPGIYI